MPAAVTDLITTSALPDALRTIYSAELEVTSRPNAIYEQFCEEKRDFAAKKGQLVYWTIYNNLPYALAPLTENVDVTGGKVTDFQVSLSVDEYGDAIGTTEKLDLLSYHGPIGDLVRNLLSPQMAGTMDVLARNAFIGTGSTHRSYGGTASSRALLGTGSEIAANNMRVAAHALSVRRIPPVGGSYIALAHSSVVFDLRNDAYWKDAQLYAGAMNIFNGEEGMLHGVRFIKSDHAVIFNGGAVIAQSKLASAHTAGTATLTLDTGGGALFSAGQQVTVLTSTSIGAVNTGTDAGSEEVEILSILGDVLTLRTKLLRDHVINARVVEAVDVYPITFLGSIPAVGKGIVLPPEVRVALPTDKLRRMNYVGWYALLGFGVLRDWAIQTLEVSSASTAYQNFYP